MFNTVIVATDLSAASDALIDGLALLRPLGAETAVLCHALGIHGHETLYPMLARFVEPRIKQQQERLQRLGFKVDVEIAPGVPALEIHRVATERGAGLIAVGSRGATLAREILLGGTATEVLHQARVPVLLVRIVMAAEGEEGTCQPAVTSILRGVLYPTDCSKATMSAFSCVDEMVARGVTKVILAHVSEWPRSERHAVEESEGLAESDCTKLGGFRERLQNRGAKDVSIELLRGAPGREIVALAARGDSDLIVMGSQGRGLLEEVFLGSVSHYVARHASLPVLLVPFKGAKSPGSTGGTA